VRRAPDANAWLAEPAVAAMLAEHGRERGVAPSFHAHAARIAYQTLARPLDVVGRGELPALIDATALAREVEFAYPIPNGTRGLVTGFIDALVAYDDELWVVDYKSDVLADPAHGSLDHVRKYYGIQPRLYALAAERLRGGRRLGGMLFAFVRYGTTVALPIDSAKLAEWAEWLANLRTEAS
jgi:ATP-dependent exoDNAse (exonuclease V) beta subunit